MRALVAQRSAAHKRAMSGPLFDTHALDVRRRRAEHLGPELFLHERIAAEIMERLAPIRRTFRAALVVGWPADFWRDHLGEQMACATFVDAISALAEVTPGSFDLCVVIGELDTADDLPLSAAMLRHALRDDALLIGAVSGGKTLPALRAAMRAADERVGAAAPHVHPRIEAAALASLLTQAGFVDPVVDRDRVHVSYKSLGRLVADLRRMAATNVLVSRSRLPLTRDALSAANQAFAAASQDGRTTEIFELLHFAAWTPPGA